MTGENPLKSYFRKPGIHIDLPSQLKWYDEDFIETSVNHEVAVYPMTGEDEIITKNPDSLFNGSGIEQIIKSCVPGVKNPRKLIAPDVDAIMLAIRVASYGDNMTIKVKCPNCSSINEKKVNLRNSLENMSYLDGPYYVEIDDLKIELKPFDYETQLKVLISTFKETKMLQQLENSDLEEEDMRSKFSDTFKKLTNLTFEILSNSILRVIMPNGEEVTEKEHINEFLKNIDKDKLKAINSKTDEINKIGADRNVDVVCDNCEHEWTTQAEFDPSNFFE